jgi:lauroyl/myristoyl acyltransferase
MKRTPKTVSERQATLRAKNKAWLKANGFNSVEGLISALRRGSYCITLANQELHKIKKAGEKHG